MRHAHGPRALIALPLLVLFSLATIVTTVASLGGYCLTSHGGDVRALTATLAAAQLAPAAHATETRSPAPVLVELFTSEGCSSCPPADALLSRLIERQPVEGALVIALEQHVDIWNRLGWKDPFSTSDFSTRQRRYGSRFGLARIYTPQMIVDGTREFVGSDRDRAERAIADAARAPKPFAIGLDVEGAAGPSGAVTVRMTVRLADEDAGAKARGEGETPGGASGLPGDVRVFLALTEYGLATEVPRGENARRRLPHDAVARLLEDIGRHPVREGNALTLSRDIRLEDGWNRDALRVVAFLTDPGTGRVLGVSQTRLR